MADEMTVVASFEVPAVSRNRLIWQPVTDADGVKMRLAPLDWQPSGAHHALEHLAVQKEGLEKQNAFLEAKLAKAVEALHWIGTRSIMLDAREDSLRLHARMTLAELKGETDE